MSDLSLAAFLVLLVLLFGVAALPWRFSPARYGCAMLAGLGAILTLPVLLLDLPPAALVLPLGLPIQGLHVALDPVAAGLLLLLFTAGIPIALCATQTMRPPNRAGGVAVCLAGLGFAVLAADGFALSLGIAVAGYALAAERPSGRARAHLLLPMLLAAGGLLLAVLLLSRGAIAGFDAIREARIEDRPLQDAGFIVAVIATGALAGVAPPRLWSIRESGEASTPSLALIGGALAPVALGLLLRLAFDLADSAPPLWWAVLPIGVGAAAALSSGWRAATAPELDAAVAALVGQQTGLVMIAFGVGLLAEAADLPGAAALSVAAIVLLLATLALAAPLTTLAAAALQAAGGSRRIDRLGGLVHAAPTTVLALLAGLASLVMLPPSAGFAGIYLLLEAVLTAPRTAGIGPAILVAVIIAVLALAAAFGTGALVRLVGVACLGRPRTPRAAAAPEVPHPIRVTLLSLAGLVVLLGLLPGVALQWLAAPAIERLAGATLDDRAGLLHLGPGAGAPGYAPLPLAALLSLAASLFVWFARRRRLIAGEVIPLWQDGVASTAAWMPFGDPLTQSAGSGFVPPLPAILGFLQPPTQPAGEPGRASLARQLGALLKSEARWLLSRASLPQVRRHAALVLLIVFALVLAVLAFVWPT